LAVSCHGTSAAEKVPILYSTDLYHPHADPDDHYDLATLFALAEFDIRGIILDNVNGGQATRCGRGTGCWPSTCGASARSKANIRGSDVAGSSAP
jgi:hypothetical protein